MADFAEVSTIEDASVKFDDAHKNDEGLGYLSFIPMPVTPNGIDDWWTPKREIQLQEAARRIDHLKITINTFISKASAVPIRFIPENQSNVLKTQIAEELHTRLTNNSELLKGWHVAFKKFAYDYLTQDNGGFMYIYGDGNKLQPIIGLPYGVEHLPSQKCTRTNNPEYPVRYHHTDGKRYLIHFTRIIEMCNLPQPVPEKNGIGMCPVSLCLDAARELYDIMIYSQEKLGSRPQRQIIYAKTGATIGQMESAFLSMDMKLESQGFTRFAKTGLLAPKLPGGKLELEVLDLVTAPDGFDRQTIVMLDLATIAASFGLDLRDLAYSFGISGQTKSDAEVQHEKGFGKGVAEFLTNLAIQFSSKFCPDGITAQFDYVDDAQDEAQANIRSVRTQSRTRDIMAGIATVRSTRLQMLDDHEIDENLFEEMELEDGRLPDGTDLNRLLYTEDTYTKQFLNFTAEFPEDVESEDNDPVETMAEINENLVKTYQEFEKVQGSQNKLQKVKRVLKLLTKLKKAYTDKQTQLTNEQKMMDNALMGISSKDTSGEKPNNAISPQERMMVAAGKGTKKGLPQPNKQKGGQNGSSSPLS